MPQKMMLEKLSHFKKSTFEWANYKQVVFVKNLVPYTNIFLETKSLTDAQLLGRPPMYPPLRAQV